MKEIKAISEDLCLVILLNPQSLFRIAAPEPPLKRGTHFL
jgi:hypothetical protein